MMTIALKTNWRFRLYWLRWFSWGAVNHLAIAAILGKAGSLAYLKALERLVRS